MAKVKNCLFALLILLFGAIGLCKAEPDSTIKYLMNEPVSLLDWGIFKYRKALEEIIVTDGREVVSVNYSYKENKILIQIITNLDEESKETFVDGHLLCKHIVAKIRTFGGESLIESYFSHTGYQRENQPDDLGKNILKIIDITILITPTKWSKGIICKAPLVGKDIYFKE